MGRAIGTVAVLLVFCLTASTWARLAERAVPALVSLLVIFVDSARHAKPPEVIVPPGLVHEAGWSAGSCEWYTPPEVFEALGLSFDLDPAAPPGGVPWVPARAHFSAAEDGLRRPWRGRVWLNPPYGRQTPLWLERLAAHGDGIALVFARSDTAWFQAYAARATALCFIAGRLKFVPGDGRAGASTAGAPSLLLAFGLPCACALGESGLGQTFVVPHTGRP